MDESENVVQIYLQRRLKIRTEICVANLARRSAAELSWFFVRNDIIHSYEVLNV